MVCMSGVWCWGRGSILLSLPIVYLVAMQFPLPNAISLFCACFNPASDFGCFHPFNGSGCASFHVFNPFVSISSSVSFMKETSLSWSQSAFELLHSAVSSSEVCGLPFHLCVESIVSFFRVPLIVSRCQRANSASAWSPCWISGVCVARSTICCELLFESVERCPSGSDSIFDFCCFLLLKRNCLPEIFALSRADKISSLMLWISTSFLLFEHWLLRIFILSRWIFNPTLSVLCLKSHIIFWSCTSDVENNSTSSTKRRSWEAIRLGIT